MDTKTHKTDGILTPSSDGDMCFLLVVELVLLVMTTCKLCMLKIKYAKILEEYCASIERRIRSDRILLKALSRNIRKLRTAPKNRATAEVIEDLIFIQHLVCEQSDDENDADEDAEVDFVIESTSTSS